MIRVEARLGVRLISWSSIIGVKPLAFIGHGFPTFHLALLVPLPRNLRHLRVSGSNFLEVISLGLGFDKNA